MGNFNARTDRVSVHRERLSESHRQRNNSILVHSPPVVRRTEWSACLVLRRRRRRRLGFSIVLDDERACGVCVWCVRDCNAAGLCTF